MSRAFVRESDQDTESLPERALSTHPNLVTARGLGQLEARVRELEAERSVARGAADQAALARIARDLRYFQARRDSAKEIAASANPLRVRFGVRVRLQLADGSERSFRLVGEDEADPAAGLISYVSPLAQALLGRGVDDELPFAAQTAEIVALEI